MRDIQGAVEAGKVIRANAAHRAARVEDETRLSFSATLRFTPQDVAALLRASLASGSKGDGLSSWGLTLDGAEVDGDVDLRDWHIHVPLCLIRCRLKGSLRLDRAHLRRLSLQQTRAESLQAEGLKVEGTVNLLNARFGGARDGPQSAVVNLLNAQIAGDLILAGALIDIRRGAGVCAHWAVLADRLSCRTAFLRNCTLIGGLHMMSATLSGALSMDGARVAALACFCDEPPTDDPLGQPHSAIELDMSTIARQVEITRDQWLRGESLSWVDAIRDPTPFGETVKPLPPSKDPVFGSRRTAASRRPSGPKNPPALSICGKVSLRGVTIGGYLSFRGARLGGLRAGKALIDAYRLNVGGNLEFGARLDEAPSENGAAPIDREMMQRSKLPAYLGRINLRYARIGGSMLVRGGLFAHRALMDSDPNTMPGIRDRSPHDRRYGPYAMILDKAHVEGSTVIDKAVLLGGLRADATKVASDFILKKSTVLYPAFVRSASNAPPVVNLVTLDVGGALSLKENRFEDDDWSYALGLAERRRLTAYQRYLFQRRLPVLSLLGARARAFLLEADGLPRRGAVDLRGFTYESLNQRSLAQLDRLTDILFDQRPRDEAGYSKGVLPFPENPYEVLERVLRGMGRYEEANRVALRRAKHRLRLTALLARNAVLRLLGGPPDVPLRSHDPIGRAMEPREERGEDAWTLGRTAVLSPLRVCARLLAFGLLFGFRRPGWTAAALAAVVIGGAYSTQHFYLRGQILPAPEFVHMQDAYRDFDWAPRSRPLGDWAAGRIDPSAERWSLGSFTRAWRRHPDAAAENAGLLSPLTNTYCGAADPVPFTKSRMTEPRAFFVPADFPCFSPFIYTLDVVLPIVDLKQEVNWKPKALAVGPGPAATTEAADGAGAVSALPLHLHWIKIVLGWLLTTLLITGVTAVLRRE